MSPSWRDFLDEIARSADAGRPVEFWWRDDDASRPGPVLTRLVTLAQRMSIPLALAAIPALSDRQAFQDIGPLVSVLQHGADHTNRASAGEKKTEFPDTEPLSAALARLADGRRQLEALAGRFLPVLAPPWNRLPEPLARQLPGAGLRGLSRYGPRSRAECAPGVRQVNTHADIIAWRTSRAFVGEDQALGMAIRHLAAKRKRMADPDEATGWLTHHAVHDEPSWAFLERLFELTRALPGVAWRRPGELFNIP